MDLNERFNILVQGVELAQKSGVLTLDNAVESKRAIEKIQKGEDLNNSLNFLVGMCEFAQKRGVYALHDAYVLYVASNDINKEIENFLSQNNGNGDEKEDEFIETPPENKEDE